jgi:hypothetical protein
LVTDPLRIPLDLVKLGINARATYAVPAIIAVPGDKAGLRFLEFFATNTRNPHTRRLTPALWQSFRLGVTIKWCLWSRSSSQPKGPHGSRCRCSGAYSTGW